MAQLVAAQVAMDADRRNFDCDIDPIVGVRLRLAWPGAGQAGPEDTATYEAGTEE